MPWIIIQMDRCQLPILHRGSLSYCPHFSRLRKLISAHPNIFKTLCSRNVEAPSTRRTRVSLLGKRASRDLPLNLHRYIPFPNLVCAHTLQTSSSSSCRRHKQSKPLNSVRFSRDVVTRLLATGTSTRPIPIITPTLSMFALTNCGVASEMFRMR